MADIDSRQQDDREAAVLDQLEHLIFNEHKLVSAKWLCNHFQINFFLARQILSKFAEKHENNLLIHHCITGYRTVRIEHDHASNSVYFSPHKKLSSQSRSTTKQEQPSSQTHKTYSVLIAPQQRLADIRAQFDEVHSVDVHCVAVKSAQQNQDFHGVRYQADFEQELAVVRDLQQNARSLQELNQFSAIQSVHGNVKNVGNVAGNSNKNVRKIVPQNKPKTAAQNIIPLDETLKKLKIEKEAKMAAESTQNKSENAQESSENKQCSEKILDVEKCENENENGKEKQKPAAITDFFNKSKQKQKQKIEKPKPKTKTKKNAQKSSKKTNQSKSSRKRKRETDKKPENPTKVRDLCPIEYDSESSGNDEDEDEDLDQNTHRYQDDDDEELEAMKRSHSRRKGRKMIGSDEEEDGNNEDEDEDNDVDMGGEDDENLDSSAKKLRKKNLKKEQKMAEKREQERKKQEILEKRKNNFFGKASVNLSGKKPKKYRTVTKSYVCPKTGMFVTEDVKETDDEQEDTTTAQPQQQHHQPQTAMLQQLQNKENENGHSMSAEEKTNETEKKKKKAPKSVKKKSKTNSKKKTDAKKNQSITSFFKTK
eukprot:CAMPEP_0202701240 /NCGR_PEP_ID=MMETSP1385-20130828/14332_1 /ASSEMBLY_ACC=CAM_ASM_000861 /TAXON_ID=933848 /ORGANISM="Elphidium margaritaceum" /LENGTH=594 /DNA_ID=CAMNT_0049358611 /DNA_START=26 /DNA_END=1810 /DNA_ORIENTATION=-